MIDMFYGGIHPAVQAILEKTLNATLEETLGTVAPKEYGDIAALIEGMGSFFREKFHQELANRRDSRRL